MTVSFSLDDGSTCSGYTFWLQLPEELAFVTYEKNSKTYITISEPADGRLHFDETSTVLPDYTAGEKADVTMKRTIIIVFAEKKRGYEILNAGNQGKRGGFV